MDFVTPLYVKLIFLSPVLSIKVLGVVRVCPLALTAFENPPDPIIRSVTGISLKSLKPSASSAKVLPEPICKVLPAVSFDFIFILAVPEEVSEYTSITSAKVFPLPIDTFFRERFIDSAAFSVSE